MCLYTADGYTGEMISCNEGVLEWIKKEKYHFSDCLYCDALMDQYEILRSSTGYFLAEDGNYSGAVEQIVEELATDRVRKEFWEPYSLPPWNSS